MTPKEKASEIIEKYFDIIDGITPATTFSDAKLCALIYVDGLITDGNLEFMKIEVPLNKKLYEYWIKVRKPTGFQFPFFH